MRDRQIPTQACIACGYVMDMVSNMFNHIQRPKVGDLSVCMKCGHLTAFDENMMHRPLNDEEQKYIAGDPRLLALQQARGEVLNELEERGEKLHDGSK